ncbi:hypothetical protein AN220_17565 [Streptomyces nanshensis]|nr:hypothetical protein AN220_17565 [Streptomyces nanshensis]
MISPSSRATRSSTQATVHARVSTACGPGATPPNGPIRLSRTQVASEPSLNCRSTSATLSQAVGTAKVNIRPVLGLTFT